jgi:hypothetical protein
VYNEIKNIPKIKVKHSKTFSFTKEEREKASIILKKRVEDRKKLKKTALENQKKRVEKAIAPLE